jgi:hypothetical protein
MRKFATPELKRAAAAMKSAEKDFFHHGQSAAGKKCQPILNQSPMRMPKK